jgi:hypothetical protein
VRARDKQTRIRQLHRLGVERIQQTMADRCTPRVIDAETISDDIIITFSNGVSALYRAALLLSVIDRATKLPPEPMACAN